MIASCTFKIHQGVKVLFWIDPWLNGPIRERYQELYEHATNPHMTVQEALTDNSWLRHITLPLTQMAQEQQTELYQEIIQKENDLVQHDTLLSKWHKDGLFTVKTFYNAMMQGPYVNQRISAIWKYGAPTRVTIFIWLMMKNKILTVDNLQRRGWNMANRCSLCKSQQETIVHLFSGCVYTKSVLQNIRRNYGSIPNNSEFAKGNFKNVILNGAQKNMARLQITTAFVIWRERCNRIFSEKQKEPQYLASEIIGEVSAWFGSDS